jgi:hypothetical protein
LRRTVALCRSAGVPVPSRVRARARASIVRLLRSS